MWTHSRVLCPFHIFPFSERLHQSAENKLRHCDSIWNLVVQKWIKITWRLEFVRIMLLNCGSRNIQNQLKHFCIYSISTIQKQQFSDVPNTSKKKKHLQITASDPFGTTFPLYLFYFTVFEFLRDCLWNSEKYWKKGTL